MADFIVAVFFFNLIFGILLFIVRRRIPITAPTLALTALISFTCTISFPYLAARLDYPGHAAVFLAIIILFAIILSFWDGRQPVPAGNTSRAEHNPSGSRENNDAQKRGAASISAAGQEHAGPKTVDAMPLSHGQETPVSEEQPAEQPVSTVTAINTAAPQVGQPAAAIAESAATDSGLEVEKAEAETPAVRLETAAETETESEPHAEPEGPAMEPKPAPEITAPEETAATKPPQETPHGEAEKAEAETPAVRLEAAAGTETGSEPHAEPEDPAVEPKPVPKITAPEETATTKPPQE
ncbi:MAG: hypothetical protein MJA84_16520, partial [Firmicutes bacterium]|nr:hypothetical protein [Bacillota bacterium]